jgi:hypothetical protein
MNATRPSLATVIPQITLRVPNTLINIYWGDNFIFFLLHLNISN